MTSFQYTTNLPFSVDEVFAWHERPGALNRLCSPWNSSVTRPSSHGIEVGSIATLRLAIPGTFGAIGVPWTAEHVALDPGNSFTDVMASGPLGEWRHHHAFAANVDGGTTLTDTIRFHAPLRGTDPIAAPMIKRVLRANFGYRERQLLGDLTFHADHHGPRRVIAVAGASGLIGTQLCALLSTGGHEVRRLVRRPARRQDEISWDPHTGRLPLDRLSDVDVIVHLGGHTIGGRFTRANKARMVSSRIESTMVIADAVATLNQAGQPVALVCASAIGFYGAQHGDEQLDESSRAGDDFLARLCADWEAHAARAAESGARVVSVRTGIVQTPGGGALARQLPLFRLGLGGRLGSGEQWVSWIGIDDIAGVFAHCALRDDVDGPINAVAPNPVRASEFAATLGSVLHRPSIVPVPGFGPALLLGREGAREIALASQRVTPSGLSASGYRFRHVDLHDALAHNLGR